MADTSKKEAVTNRRKFLQLASAGAAGAGAALLSGEQKAQAAEAKPDKSQLYRETEHIKRYYELAR